MPTVKVSWYQGKDAGCKIVILVSLVPFDVRNIPQSAIELDGRIQTQFISTGLTRPELLKSLGMNRSNNTVFPRMKCMIPPIDQTETNRYSGFIAITASKEDTQRGTELACESIGATRTRGGRNARQGCLSWVGRGGDAERM